MPGGGGIADVRNRTAITDSAIPNILGRHSSATRGGGRGGGSRGGIGRQSRTRQSEHPGAAVAEHPGRRRGYAGRGGGIADVRNRTAITDSAIPNILGRHSSATRGGGRGGGSRGGIRNRRQSRTRQSRTSWAGIAAQPGAATGLGNPNILGRRRILGLCRARRRDCRCSESDGNHGLGNPEHPGPA